MTHVRTQIRHEFKDVLDAAMPGHTVHASRRYKINADSLPLIDMRFLNENGDSVSMEDDQDRLASLYIRVTRQASEEDLDDLLDADAVLIEHAVAAQGRFGGLLQDINLMQTNFTDNGEGDKPMAEIVLRYDVIYCVQITDVETSKG